MDGLASARPTRSSATIAAAASSSARHASTVVVAHGHLEGRLGVAARGRLSTSHQSDEPRTAEPSRNSSTRRRSRSLVMVSPTTRPAACRARSATSARTSEMARAFSASISAAARCAQPLELFLGRGDVRVARLLGDLLGARQDLVRLTTSLGEGRDALGFGVLPIAPGLFGVLEPLLDPGLAIGQHPRHRLERERPDDREEQEEVGRRDDDLEQVDLEEGFGLTFRGQAGRPRARTRSRRPIDPRCRLRAGPVTPAG